MTEPASARVRLVDDADEPGRTTATLVASLAARLTALYSLSGADALGSLAAGICALGRDAARTADGARLRRALQTGRPGVNGDRLWSVLRIGDWLSGLPPSPVLDHHRNDLALLLAGDLEETLDLLPIPGGVAGARGGVTPEPATALDYLVGLWALAQEVLGSIEQLATPTAVPPGTSTAAEPESPSPEGPLLR